VRAASRIILHRVYYPRSFAFCVALHFLLTSSPLGFLPPLPATSAHCSGQTSMYLTSSLSYSPPATTTLLHCSHLLYWLTTTASSMPFFFLHLLLLLHLPTPPFPPFLPCTHTLLLTSTTSPAHQTRHRAAAKHARRLRAHCALRATGRTLIAAISADKRRVSRAL